MKILNQTVYSHTNYGNSTNPRTIRNSVPLKACNNDTFVSSVSFKGGIEQEFTKIIGDAIKNSGVDLKKIMSTKGAKETFLTLVGSLIAYTAAQITETVYKPEKPSEDEPAEAAPLADITDEVSVNKDKNESKGDTLSLTAQDYVSIKLNDLLENEENWQTVIHNYLAYMYFNNLSDMIMSSPFNPEKLTLMGDNMPIKYLVADKIEIPEYNTEDFKKFVENQDVKTIQDNVIMRILEIAGELDDYIVNNMKANGLSDKEISGIRSSIKSSMITEVPKDLEFELPKKVVELPAIKPEKAEEISEEEVSDTIKPIELVLRDGRQTDAEKALRSLIAELEGKVSVSALNKLITLGNNYGWVHRFDFHIIEGEKVKNKDTLKKIIEEYNSAESMEAKIAIVDKYNSYEAIRAIKTDENNVIKLKKNESEEEPPKIKSSKIEPSIPTESFYTVKKLHIDREKYPNLIKIFKSKNPEDIYIKDGINRMYAEYCKTVKREIEQRKDSFLKTLDSKNREELKYIVQAFEECLNSNHENMARYFVYQIRENKFPMSFFKFYEKQKEFLNLTQAQLIAILMVNPGMQSDSFKSLYSLNPKNNKGLSVFDISTTAKKTVLHLSFKEDDITKMLKSLADTYESVTVPSGERMRHIGNLKNLKVEDVYKEIMDDKYNYAYLSKFSKKEIREIILPILSDNDIFDSNIFDLHSAARFIERYVLQPMDKSDKDFMSIKSEKDIQIIKPDINYEELSELTKNKVECFLFLLRKGMSNDKKPIDLAEYSKGFCNDFGPNKYISGLNITLKKKDLSYQEYVNLFEEHFPNTEEIKLGLNHDGTIHTLYTPDIA